MFSFNLPLTLNHMLAAPFVARSKGAAGDAPVVAKPPAEMPLMSPYEDPLPDLDHRVRSIGEW